MDTAMEARRLRASPLYHTLELWLAEIRDAERNAFENAPASEYMRGRVAMLNDMLTALNSRKV